MMNALKLCVVALILGCVVADLSRQRRFLFGSSKPQTAQRLPMFEWSTDGVADKTKFVLKDEKGVAQEAQELVTISREISVLRGTIRIASIPFKDMAKQTQSPASDLWQKAYHDLQYFVDESEYPNNQIFDGVKDIMTAVQRSWEQDQLLDRIDRALRLIKPPFVRMDSLLDEAQQAVDARVEKAKEELAKMRDNIEQAKSRFQKLIDKAGL